MTVPPDAVQSWREHYVLDRLVLCDKIDRVAGVWRRFGDQKSGRGSVQVVSDIDDTISCSGGDHLLWIPIHGGIDRRFVHGVPYPGAFQFALELSRSGNIDDLVPLNVAVATARPKELQAIFGLKDSHRVAVGFRKCGEQNDQLGWGLGERLYGHLADWLFPPWMGKTKFENIWDMMERSDPSVLFTFIGDTGQFDKEAGMRLMNQVPNRMLALFLHVVHTDEELVDDLINMRPVIYFRTYVGAAYKAWQNGLLSTQALHNVCDAACSDFQATGIPLGSPQGQELTRDLRRYWSLLRRKGSAGVSTYRRESNRNSARPVQL